MTFDEYNTDENFENDKSSLDELVKLGLSEGKTSDEIKSSLSPKWKNSKKIGDFDSYVSKYSTPKAEEKQSDLVPSNAEKKEEVKETVKTTAPKTKNNPAISKEDEAYVDDVTGILNNAEQKELDHQQKMSAERYDYLDNIFEEGKNRFGNVDDKLVAQLPTFMFKRYTNGEFGDISDTSTPEGKQSKRNAQLRLAHFMINNLGTALTNASNVIKGKPVEQSDYDKYQAFNLEQGLENRWIKNKQETQHLIDMIKNQDFTEQELQKTASTLAQNNRAQIIFNSLGEKQKIFALNVLTEVGKKLGDMNGEQLVNTLMAMTAMGQNLDWKETAEFLALKYGSSWKDNFMDYLNGNKQPEEGTDDTDNTAGNSGNKVTLDDGTVVDPGIIMESKDYQNIVEQADKLFAQYDNGDISQEDFVRQYGALENLMKQHKWYNLFIGGLKSTPAQLKKINQAHQGVIIGQFDELQRSAKAGNLPYKDYQAQIDTLSGEYLKWGGKEKDLKNFKPYSEQSINKFVSDKQKKESKKKK